MKLAINKILSASIAIVSITIAAVVFISIRQSQKVRDTTEAVRRTEQVMQHIQQVILAAVDNETGARGFIITGKTEFLDPLLHSEGNLRAELTSLRKQLTDNPRQIQWLDSLNIYADKRFAFSDSMVRTREREGQKAAIAMVESGAGKWYTDNIRRICTEMAGIESDLLETRERQNNKIISQLDITLYTVLTALFMVSLFLIRRIKADISRQKASEQKFISLLDAAPDATIIVNDAGIIKLINQQTEKLFGYNRNELINEPVEILMPQALKNVHAQHRETFMKAPIVRSMGAGLELLAIRKDGAGFPVEISLSPIHTNDGTLVSASVRDISERKKAEEKLKKAKEDFQLLVSSVKDYAIFMLDQNGYVKSWNNGAKHIKGYTEEEVVGKPIDIFYTAEAKGRGEPQNNLKRALREGHYETEGLRVRKDGSIFYASIVFTPLYDEAGKHYGYAKVTKDITEKSKAEERILFLATIANNIQDPVIASDNNFCTTNWNSAAEKLFGWKSEEVIGKPTRDVLKIIYPELGREEILQSFNESGYWQGEVIYHTKSGKPLNILATASQLKDANEKVTGILVLAKDISERKKTEKQLEEFEHFFNNSHDLCGIANTVGYFEIINTNFSKVLGYSEKEFCETPFIELIHPDDVAVTLREYEKLKAGELTINFVNRYRKKDGSYLYLDWNATPNPLTGKLYCVARDITDRKKAEEALSNLNAVLEQRIRERTAEIEKKEKRFRALIENNYDIISLMDERFKIFYRSPSAARITGWTDEELLNIDGTKNIHPDDRERAASIVKEVMANPGKPISTLFRNQHKDGHYLWVEGTVINLLQDEDVKAIVFNFRDIRQRKKLEDLLHKANVLARIGGWEIDLVNDKVYWSDITREIHETEYSYVPDLETGLNFYKQGKGRELITEKLKEAIELGKPWDEELMIVTAKNNERWIRTMGETEFVNGKCVRIYGSFQDIDQPKKAEEAIAKTLEEKNIILESIGDAFFAVDKNWMVTYWNRIAEIALSVRKQEIVGKNLWEIFAESVDSLSYRKYHEALATNQVVHFEDYYAALEKWYEISAYPSENGLSVYFKDITERQKAAAEIKKLNAALEEKVINRTIQLKKANEELEAFTYSVSHDLRAPLRGILGFTSILEEDYGSKLDDEARRITGVIKSNTLKMGNLIDDLLTFSRMSRQDIEKNVIRSNELIQEIIDGLDDRNTVANIEWIIPSLHDAYADRNALRQVWVNLISNAIKYLGDKTNKRIDIGSVLLNDQTSFFIKDNGVGFDEKYSNKLFKVFQRLHGNNEFEGTGVGLAIVEKIVSKHGGKVWANGEVDKGAVFYFSLPVKQHTIQLATT